MKIFSPRQISDIDKKTIQNQKISSIKLMERAGKVCADCIMKQVDKKTKISVFCATGNNGGDGLVVARLLQFSGYSTRVYVLSLNKETDEFRYNYQLLPPDCICKINRVEDLVEMEIGADEVIVDAIFGNGLSRTPDGIILETIKHINKSIAYTIAIDMPSGLFAEKTVVDSSSVVLADKIITFQFPKLAFFLPDNKDFLTDWEVIDIGLDKEVILKEKSYITLMEYEELKKYYFPREDQWAHKGNYGHALFIGGSYGKIGATILGTKALLRIGAGLVTSYIPKCGYTAMQVAVPEAMVECGGEDKLEKITPTVNANVIAIGSGMGVDLQTIEAFSNFLKRNKIPLVVDADALNILAKKKELLKYLPPKTVLTPHPKELERIVGSWSDDYDKLEKVKKLSIEYNLIIVVKGRYSMVVSPNHVYISNVGNNALATAGSGDVLTGIIAGLIAQNYSPLYATILGIFLHGQTAEFYIEKYSAESFVASDIIKILPKSLNILTQ